LLPHVIKLSRWQRYVNISLIVVATDLCSHIRRCFRGVTSRPRDSWNGKKVRAKELRTLAVRC
jgi:hypothetical protein